MPEELLAAEGKEQDAEDAEGDGSGLLKVHGDWEEHNDGGKVFARRDSAEHFALQLSPAQVSHL